MKIGRWVNECEIVSPWYGIAWWAWDARLAYCLPIPLNKLAAMARAMWIWLRQPFSIDRDLRIWGAAYREGGASERRVCAAERNAFRETIKATEASVYQSGFKEGFEACRLAVREAVHGEA